MVTKLVVPMAIYAACPFEFRDNPPLGRVAKVRLGAPMPPCAAVPKNPPVQPSRSLLILCAECDSNDTCMVFQRFGSRRPGNEREKRIEFRRWGAPLNIREIRRDQESVSHCGRFGGLTPRDTGPKPPLSGLPS